MPPTKSRPRRKRDPEFTRISILEAARTIVTQDGAERLSVSSVEKLAGVNRGAAYQHFETREDLVKATVSWVSDHLSATAFWSGRRGRQSAGSESASGL